MVICALHNSLYSAPAKISLHFIKAAAGYRNFPFFRLTFFWYFLTFWSTLYGFRLSQGQRCFLIHLFRSIPVLSFLQVDGIWYFLLFRLSSLGIFVLTKTISLVIFALFCLWYFLLLRSVIWYFCSFSYQLYFCVFIFRPTLLCIFPLSWSPLLSIYVYSCQRY